MPLTPEDVRNKRFTPVRLREGYDMGEVDQFLDEVEAELERLTVENEELRAKVAAASSGETTGLIAPSQTQAAPAPQTRSEPERSEAQRPESQRPETQWPDTQSAEEQTQEYQPLSAWEPEEEAAQAEPQEPAGQAPARRSAASTADDIESAVQEVREVTSTSEASSAAARLLEIASNNAEELMEQAKEEADRVVGEAQTKADRIVNEARGKAERIETDSRIRAQKLDEETNERREQALSAIERERDELQRDVEHLRAYEREYRARLKNYFQTQLEGLASQDQSYDESGDYDTQSAPRRIRTDDGIYDDAISYVTSTKASPDLAAGSYSPVAF